MKKRWISMALALVMVLSLLPFGALAAEIVDSGACGENVTWTLDGDGLLTIRGEGPMSGDYNGMNFVPSYAAAQETITAVVIEPGVTSIGNYAFSGCAALTSVTIPETVTSIGNGAFYGCTGLKYIDIPDSVTAIEDYVFHGCAALEHIALPDSITTIGINAFSDCTGLKGITFPASVQSIGIGAFSDCAALTDITIPESVTYVGSGTFYSCTGLETVSVLGSDTEIGANAFHGCANLEAAEISGGVICNHAFSGCTSLTDVSISDRVTRIEQSAFEDCTGLTRIFIPGETTEIGNYAFRGCTHLERAVVSGTAIGAQAFSGCTRLTSVSVSADVIGASAFADCRNLTNATLYNGITRIAASAFSGCTRLPELDLPPSVETVEKDAFRDCSGLKRVSIENRDLCLEDVFLSENVEDVLFAGSEENWAENGNRYSGLPDTARYHYNVADFNNHFYSLHAAPTCTVDGCDLDTCDCGYEIRRIVFPAAGHQTALTAKQDASCTGEGYTGDEVCTVCGEITKLGEVIPAKGHRWNDGVVTKRPTEREEGEKIITCTVCGITETVTLPVITHTHSYDDATIVSATCETDGYTLHRCACGEEYKDSYIRAAGHQWDSGTVRTAPTATTEGLRVYTCRVCGAEREEAIPATGETPEVKNPFKDVAKEQYYYVPVLWAVNREPQITAGTSKTAFSPAATCTRGQVVTFLWRAAGCPEPKTAKNPFKDVKSSDYYYKAVLWAAESNITAGTGKSAFSPGAACTRAHVVTFLWRANKTPAAAGKSPFKDVKAGEYYTEAVLWAVSEDITQGTSATAFSPAKPCTRGQIVTFLYRAMNEAE